MEKPVIKKFLSLMLNPWIVFGSMIAGGIIGFAFPELGAQLSPIGHLYINLLQMSVIPILLTAVTGSLARLFISGSASRYISRLAITIVFGLMLASAIGILIGLIGKPGSTP